MRTTIAMLACLAACGGAAAQQQPQPQRETLGDWRPLWERQLPQQWREENRDFLARKAIERERAFQQQQQSEAEAQRRQDRWGRDRAR